MDLDENGRPGFDPDGRPTQVDGSIPPVLLSDNASDAAGMVDNGLSFGPGESGRWPYIEEAWQAVQSGEPVLSVASRYGLTPRSLKIRLRKHVVKSTPHEQAVASLAKHLGVSATPSPTGATRPAVIPAQPQDDAQKAVAQCMAIMTPQALVATQDALTVSTSHLALFLARVPHSKLLDEALPLSETERKMLEPWAAFGLTGLPDALKADPSLGIKLYLGLVGFTTISRAIMVVSAIREARGMREHPTPSGPTVDAATIAPQAP